jgi:hypothetical protein
MACDIANGRAEVCKDAVGGIDAIYFINYGIESGDITYDVTNTDVIDAVTGVASIYKYELKGNNTMSQVITPSRENGTTVVEQTITAELKKQDITTHKNVKLMAYGRPHVIVKTRNNQYYLCGLNWGMELTTASVENGVALGDFTGYKLTLVGQEKLLANLIDVTTDAALATAFDDATIVTV